MSVIEQYMADVRRIPLLTKEEEIALSIKSFAGDIKARHKLIQANLRFVVKEAYRRAGCRRDTPLLMELVQEGNLSLIKAAETFNPDYKVRFITYASWKVTADMNLCIIRSRSIVKLGTTQAQRDMFFRFSAALAELQQKDPYATTNEALDELSRTTGISKAELEGVHLRHRGDVSTEDRASSVYSNSDFTVGSTLVDRTTAPTDAAYANDRHEEEVHEALTAALRTLKPRERAVIERHYLTEEPETYEKISKDFNVSRQAICLQDMKARSKLKEALQKTLPVQALTRP